MSTPPPPPGFTLDGAAPARRARSSPPPPPDGFTVDETETAIRSDAANLPSLGNDSIVRPIDGDTLRLQSGSVLRLLGVDAPELKQQGWDRRGQAVPIGQQSLDGITKALGGLSGIIGKPVGESYGRMVAPVDLSGSDLGQSLARAGNALAAPDYLKSDPDRRFDYMQAERLARQNRLGIHDTRFQPPEEFRAEPMPAPSRETVAQFWDTPTPMAGLRPEVEQGYLAITRTGTAADILAYAEANGFRVDPEKAAKFVAERNAGKKFNNNVVYEKVPQPLTDLGDGKTGAAVRGFGNGVLPNFLEEAGAIPDTFGLTPGRENVWNSDRRLADIYSNNLGQNEAIIGFDRSAHPYVTGAAEVAGGVVLPIGRVRSAADLAKWGGAFGAVSGLGQDGTIPERMTSGVVGAGIGLGTTVLGGKALEAAAPYAGQLWRRVRGNGPEATPAAPVGASDGIPAPPEGFTPDAPPAGSMPMQADGMPASQDVPRQRDYLFAQQQQPTRMDQPLTAAQVRAASEQVDPRDVLPIPSNMVGSAEEAAAVQTGKNALATASNEKLDLTRRTVKAWNGAEVPKVGPIDMVGWLRLQGGVQNQGDELSHMALDNRARNMVEALSDPARNTQNMLERLVGSLVVPAGVAGVARALDPTARQTESIGDAVSARIPGMRDDLLPRRDIWGEPVVYDSGFLSPAYISTAKNDPVNLELLKLDYAPGYVPGKVGGRELTAEEQDAYQEQAGKLSHQRLTDVVAGAEWRDLDVEGRAKAAKKVVDQARKEVREALFSGGDEPVSDDDDLSGFNDETGQRKPKANDEWSTFKDPPQRDVMGNLTRRIPGMTADLMTSGYRTPEYQADMQRRGYKPAANSAHLDGSSLDIKVPPGKSMRWLEKQVKRVEPDAALLPEGDHLHATFPGWYGAPVLGGAAAAGLRNPMSGR